MVATRFPVDFGSVSVRTDASHDWKVAPPGWTGDGRVFFVEGDGVVKYGGGVRLGADESVERDTSGGECAVSVWCVNEREDEYVHRVSLRRRTRTGTPSPHSQRWRPSPALYKPFYCASE